MSNVRKKPILSVGSSRNQLVNTHSKVLVRTERPAVEHRLLKHFAAFASMLKVGTADFDLRWNCPDLKGDVSLNDFHIIKTLGVGGFGRCVLASKVTDQSNYCAIKVLDKENVVKYKQVEHVMQEIRVLDAVRFTFLVHLLHFFKNNCYLFCALPFISGGEMFNMLSKEGRFNEEAGQFYAAQVILAFEYFHANGVIYRDLKPENILIDSDGYIKVTDYGFCKRVNETRTWTLCGTPEYLAPEVILSQGYNNSVDWWTLGVLIFEMVAGHPPFHSSDPMKLYTLIVHGKYTMNENFSRPLQHLVHNLLQTNRDKRFGVMKNGVKDIKMHEWFRKTDWSAILEKQVKPPIIPKKCDPLENTNFDVYREEPMRTNAVEEYPREFGLIAVKATTTNRR